MARIAVLLHGGLENVAAGICIPALSEWLRRLSLQHDLHIFSLRGARSPWAEARLGRAPLDYLDHSGNYRSQVGAFYRAVLARHDEDPFQLIHGVWGLPGGLAAVLIGKRLRRPAVISLQGSETASLADLNYGMQLTRKNRWLLRRACRGATAITTLSHFQAQLLSAQTGCHATVIPYGADLTQFSAVTRTPEPPFGFLHVAHQNPVKDQFTLLQAFKEMLLQVPCHLTVIGGDFMSGGLKTFAEELGIANHIRFEGQVAHQRLAPFFASANCLLHTSRYEAQAVVVAEALASGLAVCGTRVGLIADLEGEATVAVAVGDAEGLARATVALMSNPEQVQHLTAVGLAWAQDNQPDHTVTRFSELYQALIQQGAPL